MMSLANFSHINVAFLVRRNPQRSHETRGIPSSVEIARLAGHPGQGADRSIAGNFPNGVVPRVREVETLRHVNRNASGRLKTGVRSVPSVIAASSGLSGKYRNMPFTLWNDGWDRLLNG